MKKRPPFEITSLILRLSQAISRELGALAGARLTPEPLRLRRENKIKTIQSSLAIEGNTLSLEQVSRILDGKRVIGPQKDILEVKNAISVYEILKKINPLSVKDFLGAHKKLMQGLIDGAGKWRKGGVGVFKGQQVAHMAPPAKRVPLLMENLFDFLKKDSGVPWLIKACVFHYELEFIHPFADGNGRMGRFWQHLLLMKEDPSLEFISVESIIKSHQKEYYVVLGECDKKGDSTLFVEFALKQILIALKKYTEATTPLAKTPKSRLEFAKSKLSKKWFSRSDYNLIHKDISTATASRDLANGLKVGTLKKQGDKNQAKYRFS